MRERENEENGQESSSKTDLGAKQKQTFVTTTSD